jgi:putative Holliday junction resolvase
MDRILCLDLGLKRIGVALSDGLGITAQSLTTLDATSDYICEVQKIIDDHTVTKVIIGYPLNLDGREGNKAQSVKAQADEIRSALTVDVELWDERLSTKEAQRIMQYNNVNQKDQKKVIDQLAAQIILQNYLNTQSMIKDRQNFNKKGVVKKMDDDNKIVLISEQDDEIEYMIDDEFEFDGNRYLVLCEDEESEDALLFRLEEGAEGEMLLIEVMDDDEFDKVSQYYFEN